MNAYDGVRREVSTVLHDILTGFSIQMNWLGQLKCVLMKAGKVHISEPLSDAFPGQEV